MNVLLQLLAASGTLGFLFFVIWLIKSWHDRVKINLALTYTLLLVKIPRPQPEEETRMKPQESIATFENFLHAISRVQQPVVFEIAVPHFGEEVFFYVAVPRREMQFIQKTIQAMWPGSEAEQVLEDYNIFNPEGGIAGTYLSLKHTFYLGLKTYAQFTTPSDPLEGFLGAFAKLAKEGEGLAYQVIIKPVGSKLNQRMRSFLKQVREGKRFEEVIKDNVFQEVSSEVLKTFEPRKSKKEEEEQKMRPKPVDELLLKVVEAKAAKPLFEVNVRLSSSAATEERAREIVNHLEGAFRQVANAPFNEFSFYRPRGSSLHKLLYHYSFRIFTKGNSKMILNAEEIASLVHFPTPFVKTPLVHWLKSRSAPPPVNLPEGGVVLGESAWKGERRLVRLLPEDRRRHLYTIGQTGTGKTTLLKNIATQDIEEGRGMCFIDPHGDVAEELIGLIPKTRADDVIYFNPGDPQRPVALNILEYDPNYPEQKTFLINELIEIIDKLYNLRDTGGPMFEQYLRNSLLLIMDDPSYGATLLEVSRVFVDAKFRKEMLERCKNFPVVEFWTQQVPRVGGELSLENMITWVTSKLNPFITNDFLRPIIAQPKSAFNMRHVMDEGKILIINLAKGRLGDISSYLMGMVVVGRILAAAFSRTDVPEEQRRDFFVTIDEFQNFAFKTVASILAEARKYRLSLTLAHQYLGQLPDEIKSAVFGNVGTIASFRIGVEDAEVMEKQFVPVFSRTDLLNIENYHAYLKLLIQGYISQPFNIKTLVPRGGNPKVAELIKELSALKFGRHRDEIEQEIREKYGYSSLK